MKRVLFLLTLFFSSCSVAQVTVNAENAHYFNLNGKPTILIASGEHYGAVVNQSFDYEKYLAALQHIGLNHTRIFLGDYVEGNGAFCIKRNTLNPGDNFICPWERSNVKGYKLGGNKYDLNQWNKTYFQRLNDFLKSAEKHGVVVEMVLFFASYTIENSPFYFKNNINGLDSIGAKQYMVLESGKLLYHQEQYVKKILEETNQFDNIFFNIANEPWFDNQAYAGFSSPTTTGTKKWIQRVSDWIVSTERHLPKQHILSVDYCNEGKIIPPKEMSTYFKNISVFNHHYDKNAESVRLNYANVNKIFSFNETGLMPPSTPQYRIQGWKYIFNGGALYNNLDYTFQVGFEDGTGNSGFSCDWYSGCDDPIVKYELANLLKFFSQLDFVHLNPDKGVIVVNYGNEQVHPMVNVGKEYALYFEGGNKAKIMLSIPNGSYKVQWINPADLTVISKEIIEVKGKQANLLGPEYKEDILLFIAR